MTVAIKFSARATELEAALPLKDVEKRFLARLRNAKFSVASGVREQHAQDAPTFLKYLFADPEAELSAVIDAMTDLTETGIIELRVPDVALFKDQLRVVVAELEEEAACRK